MVDNIKESNNANDTSSVSNVGGEAEAKTQLEAEKTTAQTNQTEEQTETNEEEKSADKSGVIEENNDDVKTDNQKNKKISQSTVSKVVAKQRREYKREINDYQEQLNALKEKQAELEKVLNSANHENSKLKVINEFKLDNELSSLITADNEEAMREQAQVISSRLTSNKGIVLQEGTNPNLPQENKSWLERLMENSNK